MTDVHDLVDDVEGTDAFREFRDAEPDRYLVHVFHSTKQGTELGYYDPGEDTIVSFGTAPVSARDPEEVFKESGTLSPLELDGVDVGLEGVRKLLDAYRKENYPTHPVQSEILILQQEDGPVWNCTLVTQTLNMLIMKVHAGSGEVLSEEMRNILDLRK